MTSEIRKLLEAVNSHPFLFVGSGFTHRHLGTEDWKGLINHFARQAKPETEFAFEWYRNEVEASDSGSGQHLPEVTALVEKDYARRFLADESFRDLRNRHGERIRNGVSPLKIGVADLLTDLEAQFTSPMHSDEISALGHSRKNVAGIITTNFDRFLEHLFPEHVPYIGQNELLFNQSYGVGEIYKIHGCVSEPETMVLSQSDYVTYEKRNAYLSAKLMTIFLEHPIIFLGYSLTDSNIRSIFNNISNCLNESQLATLSSRLIFVQRVKDDRPEGITTVRDNFGETVIESTRVVLSDFSQLYKAIAGLRSSYSPKILRSLKKDLYELVLNTDPKERIQVVDINDATEMDKVEYVIGIGISRQLAGQGYGGLEVYDLIKDLIYEETSLDPAQVVEIVLPKLARQFSNNVPVFKYLSQAEDVEIAPKLAEYIKDVRSKDVDFWITESMRRSQAGKIEPSNLGEVFDKNDMTCTKGIQQALQEVAFVPSADLELEEFREFLISVWETYDPIKNRTEQALTTSFRKAARIYDWLKYGKKKTPEVPKGTETD